jgi:preprotein translocase SecE subunit
MARNRQRAKQRQAARKGSDGARSKERAPQPDQAPDEEEVERAIDLETGAPPQDLGTSESTLEYEQDLEEEEEDFDPEDEEQPYDASGDNVDDQAQPTGGPRGHRGGDSEHSHRPRLVQFLIAVRAELRRVEWPTRQTLTTLTGVVLGFVLLAGGYLGLLDAVFSKLVQSIL